MITVQRSHSTYTPDNVGVGIVHIGLGAFHRAHQAVYIEKNLNRNLGGDWGICAVNIRSNNQLVDQLKANDCRYHIAEYQDSQHVELREVNAIREALFAGEDKAPLFDRLVSPSTKIVTLTVTEKGYYLTPSEKALRQDDPHIQHDIAHPTAPKTAPGILVEALHRRRELGLPPFTVLSCDNMPSNGRLTREAVCSLARHRSTELAEWIESNVAFPSSMVDRIVPAMSDASRERLQVELQCNDLNAVMCESFSQWVVEDHFPQGRPDWENDGVQMVKDVHPFETMKLRLLNGSHSLLAYVGLAANYQTVAEAVADNRFAQLIRHYMNVEASPTLDLPESVDVEAYIERLVGRFGNDSLQHQLAQIAMDGSQKIPQRWLNGALERLDQHADIEATALGVAAWLAFVRGKDQAGRTYTVDDPMAETFSELHARCQDANQLVSEALKLDDIFPRQLALNETFSKAVLKAYQTIISSGVAACLGSSDTAHFGG
ncbi:mannitol dehydrogenase family protein [Marinomonas piezotolerans]|uniref:Mannitol dehydrogenase family protein n=1 Tax=Marinomonas piezotolerans TaxID=2213058 RepID=A0A370U947_9GAMM|nr:mannitol dehydrogenase family protein [Marinomonas piezotolerans]RDL44285.1 mannitol dehydrogenase family protein [Marinomonas piezotolerans]